MEHRPSRISGEHDLTLLRESHSLLNFSWGLSSFPVGLVNSRKPQINRGNSFRKKWTVMFYPSEHFGRLLADQHTAHENQNPKVAYSKVVCAARTKNAVFNNKSQEIYSNFGAVSSVGFSGLAQPSRAFVCVCVSDRSLCGVVPILRLLFRWTCRITLALAQCEFWHRSLLVTLCLSGRYFCDALPTLRSLAHTAWIRVVLCACQIALGGLLILPGRSCTEILTRRSFWSRACREILTRVQEISHRDLAKRSLSETLRKDLA